MGKDLFRKLTSTILMLAMLLSFIPTAAMAATTPRAARASVLRSEAVHTAYVSPKVNTETSDKETVIIVFQGEPAAVGEYARRQGLNTLAATATAATVRREQNSFLTKARDKGVSLEVGFQYETVLNGMAVTVAADQIPALAALPEVESIWEDTRVYASPIRTGEEVHVLAENGFKGDIYPLQQIGAIDAWAAGYTGKALKVGVIDDGVDYNHPDLKGAFSGTDYGWDFTTTTPTRTPLPLKSAGDGHGTHVAGTIVGRYAGTGATAQKGVAYEAELHAYKVLGGDQNGLGGYNSTVIAGIEKAVEEGMDVINLSLGGGVPGQRISVNTPDAIAINNAVLTKGVIAVIANGNEADLTADGLYTMGSPASSQLGISVGAVKTSAADKDVPVYWSSMGPNGDDAMSIKPDVMGPGYQILSTAPLWGLDETPSSNTDYTKAYATISGTSMATPHIAGLALLIKEAHPTWGPFEVRAALANTAEITDAMSSSNVYHRGAGRASVMNAINTPALLTAQETITMLGQEVANPNPSTSFGLVAPNAGERTKTLQLQNFSSSKVEYTAEIKWDTTNGAAPAGLEAVLEGLTDGKAAAEANAKASLSLKLTVGAAATGKFYSGFVVLTAAGAPTLHLPFVVHVGTADPGPVAPVQNIVMSNPILDMADDSTTKSTNLSFNLTQTAKAVYVDVTDLKGDILGSWDIDYSYKTSGSGNNLVFPAQTVTLNGMTNKVVVTDDYGDPIRTDELPDGTYFVNIYVVGTTKDSYGDYMPLFDTYVEFTVVNAKAGPVDPGTGGGGEYTLVTDVSTLKAGDKVIIAAKDESLGLAKFDSALLQYAFPTTAITKTGNNITDKKSATELTLGKVGNYFTFYTGTGYLNCSSTSSNNRMNEIATVGATSTWGITISAGKTSIQAQVTDTNVTRKVLQYNANQPRFSCYTDNTQAAIALYVKTDATPVTQYDVTVTGGTASPTKAAAGETVTITANAPANGKVFKEWTGADSLTFVDGTGKTSATAKFTMPSSAVSVTATYQDSTPTPTKYDVTVTGGTASPTKAAAGETVTITANAPDTGKVFKEWTGADSLTFVDGTSKTSATAKFTMPANAVSVTATYQDSTPTPTKYDVTVTGGTASPTKAAVGETITITANAPATDKVFKEWTGAGSLTFVDGTSKTSATAKFTMPSSAVSVTATYQDKAIDPVAVTGVSLDKATAELKVGSKTTLTATVVPANATNKAVTWSSSNTAVATVANGVVTAESKGEVTITVQTADGSFTATCKVTVTEASTNENHGGNIGGTTKPETETKTTVNPDGSTTVTVTDKKTGTVTATTTRTDGSKLETVRKTDGEMSIKASRVDGNVVADIKLPATVESKTFEDVSEKHWASSSIGFVAGAGLFTGTKNGFEPDTLMTRGMFVTVLHRLSGTVAGGDSISFADVKDGAYFGAAASWAARNSVVKGYSTDTFAPDENVSREMMAVILYRYADLLGIKTGTVSLEKFGDEGSVSAWASEAMSWAVANGLINGKPGDLLDPQGTASRAEVATILANFCDLLKK